MGDDTLREWLGLQLRPVNPGAAERGDASREQQVALAANLEGGFSTMRPALRQAARLCEPSGFE